MTSSLATAEDVVAFWRDAGPSRWYRKDEAFDRAFRDRFVAAHEAAARGELDGWLATAQGALALCILLDQFPRNAFRGSARMFSTDDRAAQELCVRLANELPTDTLRWAVLHRDIIERFGRFPHRNELLGRASTDEEQRFLDEGGFSG